jgi:hypothetical protein
MLSNFPPKLDIIEIEVENRICGIYFLTHVDDIVYIGQSVDCKGRIITHKHEKTKLFSRAFVYRCEESELDYFEEAFIRMFKPRYNYRKDGVLHIGVQRKKKNIEVGP